MLDRRQFLQASLVALGPLGLAACSPGTDKPAPKKKTPAVQDRTSQDAGAASTQASDPRDAEFAVDPARTSWNFESNGQKVVYLTFDDGPSYNTQPVLDILDRYGIKATFFVTGLNPDYASMIATAYQAGHTIGMHTYSHDYAKVYASTEAYWSDLNQIAEVVKGQIGYVPCFVRFPGGSSNTVSANYCRGIMTQLSQEVPAAGYQYYDWDMSCGDGATNPTEVLVGAATADEGLSNIVMLMHDANAKETTVEALPQIIENYLGRGFAFAPLDRATKVPHHGIGN